MIPSIIIIYFGYCYFWEIIPIKSKDIVASVWKKQVPNKRQFVRFKLLFVYACRKQIKPNVLKYIWQSDLLFLFFRDGLYVKFAIKSSFNLLWILGWCSNQKECLQPYGNIFNILFLINSQQVRCYWDYFFLYPKLSKKSNFV